ncbi:MAG: TetR family transcriptional regulator [Nevskiales bacterium]
MSKEILAEQASGMADGKRRLIDAALRLAAQGGSLSSLGLRELGREAGLNHNTFYRHFRDTEELGAAAVHEVASTLMAAMKEIRRNAAKHADATVGAAEYFYDFVKDNPQPFIVGLRELHSASTPMRKVLKQVLHEIAVESLEQIVTMNLAPGMDHDSLLRATSAITYYLLYRSLDCIEQPRRRQQIVDETISFMRAQFFGAAALQSG